MLTWSKMKNKEVYWEDAFPIGLANLVMLRKYLKYLILDFLDAFSIKKKIIIFLKLGQTRQTVIKTKSYRVS